MPFPWGVVMCPDARSADPIDDEDVRLLLGDPLPVHPTPRTNGNGLTNTCGWVTPVPVFGVDNSADPLRFGGFMYRAVVETSVFRVDTGPGDFTVWISAGKVHSGTPLTVFEVWKDGVVAHSATAESDSASSLSRYDINGKAYVLAAGSDWLNEEILSPVLITGVVGYIEIKLEQSSGTYPIWGSIRITQVGGAPISATVDTAWRILNQLPQDTAWRVLTSVATATAWRIRNIQAKVTAWQIQIATSLQATTAWRILTSAPQDTSWRVRTLLAQATAWRVRTARTVATAWQILSSGLLTINTAWRIATSSSQATAWRVRAQLARDTAWAIVGRMTASAATAWRVRALKAQQTAWRVKTDAFTATAWKIFNTAARNTAWRIGVLEVIPTAVWKVRQRSIKWFARQR